MDPKQIEETIYKITRAVYNRLGEKADRKTVEAIVTDVVDVIYPLLQQPSQPASTPTTAKPDSQRHFVVSVFGTDQPGIVAAVASLLAEARYSIIDINQTVVKGKFAMIMIVGASEQSTEMMQVREQLRALSQQLGVRIYFQREDLFHAMHRI
ncbi:MAG: ACT domain-containing protein [Acidobacteriota bacterium]|nr:ACT domain-containing protein [Blastocatellia bacterium]MDW8413223.1 ACT domain-containing protein [Acidobacteriota bacterium]